MGILEKLALDVGVLKLKALITGAAVPMLM